LNEISKCLKTNTSDVALDLEGGKFIQKVAAQGKSPVWKGFSLFVDFRGSD